PVDLKIRTLLSPSTLKPTRSALLVFGFQIATLEAWIPVSFSMMPPGCCRYGFGFWCFFTMLMPVTSRRPSARTFWTLPRLPLSLPAITTTSSFLRIFNISSPPLQHFRCQGNDFHELLRAQLTSHRAKDTGTDRRQ